MNLKITLSKLLTHLLGANELITKTNQSAIDLPIWHCIGDDFFHRRLIRYLYICVASYMVHSSLFFVWWQELIWHQDNCNHHCHDDVIRWKYFPRYWPFVRGIHRSPVNSPHKGQWRGALMFSLICAWIDGWVNNRKASDLRRHRANYDITVMSVTKSHWRIWNTRT